MGKIVAVSPAWLERERRKEELHQEVIGRITLAIGIVGMVQGGNIDRKNYDRLTDVINLLNEAVKQIKEKL